MFLQQDSGGAQSKTTHETNHRLKEMYLLPSKLEKVEHLSLVLEKSSEKGRLLRVKKKKI